MPTRSPSIAAVLPAVALAAVGCGARSLASQSDYNAASTGGAASSAGVDADAAAPPASDASCGDAGVQLIRASDYDQSCTIDSDCAAVGEGNACDPSSCAWTCARAAVSRRALAGYQADLAALHAGAGLPPALECRSAWNAADCVVVDPRVCHCPNAVAPCCRGGRCAADLTCAGASP